jgi:hypothetical protein
VIETTDLPVRCHVVVPGMPPGRNIAVVVRGVPGVRFTGLDFGSSPTAHVLVRALNVASGVSAAAGRLMLAGAMLGWGSVWEPDGRALGRPVDIDGARRSEVL